MGHSFIEDFRAGGPIELMRYTITSPIRHVLRFVESWDDFDSTFGDEFADEYEALWNAAMALLEHTCRNVRSEGCRSGVLMGTHRPTTFLENLTFIRSLMRYRERQLLDLLRRSEEQPIVEELDEDESDHEEFERECVLPALIVSCRGQLIKLREDKRVMQAYTWWTKG